MSNEYEPKHDLASFHLALKNLEANDNLQLMSLIHGLTEAMRQEMMDVWEYLHERETPPPVLQVKLLHPAAKVPTRGSEGAIGWDLYAIYQEFDWPDEEEENPPTREEAKQKQLVTKKTFINDCDWATFCTGLAIKIPKGYYGRIAPRSGLAAKLAIDVMAGVIDSDYRGEIKIILSNWSMNVVNIDLTKPIAQLILERADQGKLAVVTELSDTVRGGSGFGSTDKEAA